MVGCPQGLNSPPVKIGTAGLAMPGYDVKVLDEGSRTSETNELGSIVVKLPLLQELYQPCGMQMIGLNNLT